MSHDAKKYASYFASDLARAFGAVKKDLQDKDDDYASEFGVAKSERSSFSRKKPTIDRGFVQHGIYF